MSLIGDHRVRSLSAQTVGKLTALTITKEFTDINARVYQSRIKRKDLRKGNLPREGRRGLVVMVLFLVTNVGRWSPTNTVSRSTLRVSITPTNRFTTVISVHTQQHTRGTSSFTSRTSTRRGSLQRVTS